MSINCIRTLIEDANISNPNKIALVFGNEKLTYNELFTKVNQIAYYLSELDLPKGSRIGVYSNKGIDQVVAILAIFLVLYKVSVAHPLYINLKLNLLKSIVLTGGITKVLSFEESEDIISFFYKKILTSDIHPSIIMDSNYDIWTLGITQK